MRRVISLMETAQNYNRTERGYRLRPCKSLLGKRIRRKRIWKSSWRLTLSSFGKHCPVF